MVNGTFRTTGTGAAGFILRAKDVNHFYAVYFPWCGQQMRGKNFWVYVLKVEGDGYLRSIKKALVPGVPAETERWYKIRITAKGPSLDVLVDGRHAISVETDGQYESGAVGLLGYGMYFFRNIQVTGEKTPLKNWAPDQKIPIHHFTVGLIGRDSPSGCVTPNGDVILAYGKKMVRSKDKGRTWLEPVTLPKKLGKLGDDAFLTTSDGRLILQLWRTRKETNKPVPEILISESTDNGYTWSDPVQSKLAPDWPKAKPEYFGRFHTLIETADGTLLRFMIGTIRGEVPGFAGDDLTWGSSHCKAYAIRSTDGGKSWSAPIDMDQPTRWDRNEPTGQVPRGNIPGSLDLTEPTGVAIGNKVTVLVRPIYSATMWQCWSYDAGKTWDAASRTTFPGYAQSILRLKSGAILCAHRFPQYTVNISHDDGLNWDEGTIIDYPAWAQGLMIEVEPDVVLCTYQNYQRVWPLLAQLFRVTPEGIQPISR